MSHYSDKTNWIEIEKQCIFEAWVPFVPNRPINYFIQNEDQEEGQPVKGYLTEMVSDTGENRHSALIDLARRKVVVLTRDEICQNEDEEDVLIAKIISVKKRHRSQPWYTDMVDGRHQWFVHLPSSITGVEAYINMSQVTTIAKNLLIEKKSQLPKDRMILVEDRYTYGVALGVIKPDLSGEIGEEEDVAVNE